MFDIQKKHPGIKLLGTITLALTLYSLTEIFNLPRAVLWKPKNKNFQGIRRLYPEGYFGNRTSNYSDELYPATAFAFLARNGKAYLLENLVFIDRELLSKCVDWRVFYLENDSTDSTRETLQNFAREHPGRVHGEHLSLLKKHSTELCPKRNLNCPARTQLLGSLRNRLVRNALSWKKVELLVMMDVDFYRFDPQLFWRMYTNVLLPLNANGVFGLSKFSSAARGSCASQPFGCEVYDYGAIVPQDLLAEIMQARNKIGSVFPVRSAFSGFGIYNAAAVIAHRPDYVSGNVSKQLEDIGDDSKNREAWGIIEHISFNLCLTRLYLYPSFQPEYGGI